MTNLPLARLRSGHVVLLGYEHGQLFGLDPIADETFDVDASDILAAVSDDPAAVLFGVRVRERSSSVRMAANMRTGLAFPLLPCGMLSGFLEAEEQLRVHREGVPSEEAIALSMMFALATVQTTIEDAERSVACFARLFRGLGRKLPTQAKIRECFTGLKRAKARQFRGALKYAPEVRQAIQYGWRDRELRRVLAQETQLPEGIGLAKLSFTLALLGQDCVCIDSRLRRVLFPDEREDYGFGRAIAKLDDGRVPSRAIIAYERVERMFLRDNPFYDPNDPLGAARAQWMSWEATAAEPRPEAHAVWLDLVRESPRPEPHVERLPGGTLLHGFWDGRD